MYMNISRFPGHHKLWSFNNFQVPRLSEVVVFQYFQVSRDRKLWSSNISRSLSKSCGLPVFPGLGWSKVVGLQHFQLSGYHKLWFSGIFRFPSVQPEQISRIIYFQVPKSNKIDSKIILNRRKWCPGTLQKWSWKQVGSRLRKRRHRLWETGAIWAPFGWFWASFGAQLGANGIPKSTV